jgi:transposase
MVVLLGIDVHKGTHTAVAVDEVGQCVVAATDGGHRQLLGWALSRWSGDRLRFAVEDCRQVSTRLERTLLGAGQTVVRVPPKLTAGSRSAARTRGKSDPIDALAIARAALREPDRGLLRRWRARSGRLGRCVVAVVNCQH